VGVGPCHYDMARLGVADGGDRLQIRRVAVNILNKQSRTDYKGWSSSLRVGRRVNESLPKKKSLLRNVTQGLGLGQILWNGPVAGSCEQGNEPSGSIKDRDYLD
jgi:hypothetical protein